MDNSQSKKFTNVSTYMINAQYNQQKKEIKLQGDTIHPARIVVKRERKAEKSRKGQNNKCWQV